MTNTTLDKAAPCWETLQKGWRVRSRLLRRHPDRVKSHPAGRSQSHPPLVGLFTEAEALIDPIHHTIFNVRASYFLDETREQVDGLWKQLGVRRIAVLYQNDAFGTTVLQGVLRALKRYHSEPVALGNFERNTTAVEEGLKKVRAANPEAVIVVGPYLPVIIILRQSHDAGWHPRFLTVSSRGTPRPAADRSPSGRGPDHHAGGATVRPHGPAYCEALSRSAEKSAGYTAPSSRQS